MPTIVTLIEKNTDISIFYNFAEEEIHKSYKQIQAEFRQVAEYPLMESKLIPNSKIISENVSRHDNVADEIFSPPPEIN